MTIQDTPKPVAKGADFRLLTTLHVITTAALAIAVR